MSKWSGVVGFETQVETKPGIWSKSIKERTYFGDVMKHRLSVQQSTSINGRLTMSNEILILADPFANNNFFDIRYATYMGRKWCVSSIEIEYPRIRLQLGEMYNG